ncbi:MAG TPA: D-glycero-beta-D-manno-heptose 1-phosphate adenylyltransferase [Tepidisphaeraceae bacterium]|nr:D-glycero-beta-D-manno-heptose 1-phosphate adenylyltransferase [Tepidisphaeraceae bacterium]
MPTHLIELVERLPGRTIVLVGDLMVDKYLYGDAERLSPDAPVPVLCYRREENRLGGAGRVAADLSTLGAKVRVVSILGADSTGTEVRKLLAEWGCDTAGIVECADRPSTSKVRLVGLAQHRHPQQMMRLDYEDTRPVDGALAEQVIANVKAALSGADALCIEDYNKGLLPPAVCQAIIAAAREANVPVLVDPAAIKDYSKYAGASAITPNATETTLATGLPVTTEEQFKAAAERLLTDLKLDAALLTLDKRGSYLATRDGTRRWLRTRERVVYDVSGAGDMVLAMLAAARASGADWVDAAALGNIAGGLEVERFGSVPVTRPEIVTELLLEAGQHMGKQRTLEQLVPELARHRAAGKRIVFTNGCFDLIHLGHVKYFQFAKRQGDLLVVAVNTDTSIRRLKGNKRPIIAEHDRVGVLEELESIDYLLRFEEETPLELIKAIRPDVLVKGADYAKEQVVGWDIVEGYGGNVALAPLVDGRSTSAVVERILEAYR